MVAASAQKSAAPAICLSAARNEPGERMGVTGIEAFILEWRIGRERKWVNGWKRRTATLGGRTAPAKHRWAYAAANVPELSILPTER